MDYACSEEVIGEGSCITRNDDFTEDNSKNSFATNSESGETLAKTPWLGVYRNPRRNPKLKILQKCYEQSSTKARNFRMSF